MTDEQPSEPEQNAAKAPANTAVWYFVGATFLFAGPTVFSFGDNGFLRVLTLVLGAVVFVCGIIVFRREHLSRR